MSKIMDRIFDLQAVNWQTVPVSTLDTWEQEAVLHDRDCRCEKCALFFARMAPKTFHQAGCCAIQEEIIRSLRKILKNDNKL